MFDLLFCQNPHLLTDYSRFTSQTGSTKNVYLFFIHCSVVSQSENETCKYKVNTLRDNTCRYFNCVAKHLNLGLSFYYLKKPDQHLETLTCWSICLHFGGNSLPRSSFVHSNMQVSPASLRQSSHSSRVEEGVAWLPRRCPEWPGGKPPKRKGVKPTLAK